MFRIKYALLGIGLLGLVACNRTNQESVEQQQPATVQETAPQAEPPQAARQEDQRVEEPVPVRKASPPKASEAPPARVAEQPAPVRFPETPVAEPQQSEPEPAPAVSQVQQEQAVAPIQAPEILTVPIGTSLHIRLLDPLDTGVNQTGEIFRAILDRDIEVNGRIAAPRGSLLEGKLSNVVRSGRVEGRAAMSLQLVDLKIRGQSYLLQTEILSFEAESTKKEDAAKVGVGAGIGAIIGAIAGGGKGAAIGAAVGGGAGGATVLATRGNEIKFDVEHPLSFVLTRDVAVKLE